MAKGEPTGEGIELLPVNSKLLITIPGFESAPIEFTPNEFGHDLTDTLLYAIGNASMKRLGSFADNSIFTIAESVYLSLSAQNDITEAERSQYESIQGGTMKEILAEKFLAMVIERKKLYEISQVELDPFGIILPVGLHLEIPIPLFEDSPVLFTTSRSGTTLDGTIHFALKVAMTEKYDIFRTATVQQIAEKIFTDLHDQLTQAEIDQYEFANRVDPGLGEVLKYEDKIIRFITMVLIRLNIQKVKGSFAE